MSRRIEIELTSARTDGTWTWRAAGAQMPKGVLDGSILPTGAAVGTVLKAEAENDLDGLTILSVIAGKEKASKGNVLALIPNDKPFEAVTQQLARRERGERSDRGERGERRDRPPRRNDGDRRDRPSGPRSDSAPRADRPGPPRGEGAPRGDRGPRPDRPTGPRPERKPRFQAPPEVPQRPKAKRLKPGRAHRNAVLADLPEAQRAVAERAIQGGIPAVRQAVNEQNLRLRAEGREEIPAAGLLSMAEQLLPKLRVAEWLDRADAAVADLEELDLRDLRSVVAAGEDPIVSRDETTREVANRLKEALVAKQEKELALWYADIEAAIEVGRAVRALKLSSQPPKAGVRFPSELATRLAATAVANLTTDALPDRWIAVLEASAFSPVRQLVAPAAKPQQASDELLSTVKRLSPLLPQIAALFEISIEAKAHSPKPLRPTRPASPAKKSPPPPPPAPVQAEPVEPEPIEPEPIEPEPIELETVETVAVEPADAGPVAEPQD